MTRPASTDVPPTATDAAPASPRYDGDDLSVLEGLEAVRKRPGMYIGSTDSKGLTHLVYEVVDNCVDEALAGHCERIELTLHADGSVEVTDDGRGIPVDVHRKTGLTGVELVMTKLHAGGKFGGAGYKTSGGLHGVGASVVNALSARLDVVVRRDGRVHTMSFQRGVPGVFEGDGPRGAFTPRGGLSVAGKAAKGQTGTSVRWWPDLPLFTAGSAVDTAQVVARLRQTAFLVPGLTLALLDRRGGELVEESFRFDGGTADFVEHLAQDGAVCDPVHLTGEGTYKETVPVLDEQGHMVTTVVERICEVDVALRWGTGYDTVVQSFCNVVATGHGGSHQNGFEAAVLKTLNLAMRDKKVLKVKDEDVSKDDVLEGLTAVITVKVPEPQYLGQTKDELGTPGVRKIVADVVAKGLRTQFLDDRKRKAQVEQVLRKVAAAAETRKAAKASKDAARRKTALETSTLPAKLADCRSTDVGRTELWLVEGDSALGTGKLARNSEFQALLPLRGKILNVQKAGVSEMLGNAECASIIQVVGAGTGRTFDLDQMRYGKIVLMSVHPDDSVLVLDERGHQRLTSIGAYTDERLAVDDHVPLAGTISYDSVEHTLRASPLKRVIRHHYQGQMITFRTEHGREVRVTSGHSVFAWTDDGPVLVPSDELRVGDRLVAPRRLPRPEVPLVELDLLPLARSVGGYRVVGPGVAASRQAQSAPTPSLTDPVDRVSRRVEVGPVTQELLRRRRTALGLTQSQVAAEVGYAQPISVSAVERGLLTAAEPVFRRWLALLDLPWPEDARLVPGVREQHRAPTGSAHDRYRALGEHAWLDDVPPAHDALLGREVVLHTRAHLAGAFGRFRAVDEDLCEFLGWYLAEGSLSRGVVRLHLGEDDAALFPGLVALVERTFGVTPRLVPDRGRSVTMRFASAEATLLVRGLGLAVGARDKRVPDLLLNVDESCQLAFLAGYHLGDGTKGRLADRLAFTTASRACADALGYLLAQLGILPSFSARAATETTHPDGRPIRSGTSTSVTITGRDQLRRLRRVWRDGVNAPLLTEYLSRTDAPGAKAQHISPDLVALRIREVSSEAYDGPVYDFSVADDESFVVGFGGGVCAHNTDADVDGAHIRCLLITLFARYMRPVIESGRLFAAVPPLHRVEVANQKDPVYTYSDKQLAQTLKRLEQSGKKVKGQIQRYKGLGEMDPDQLADTTMHPASRTLRRIQPGDADGAERALELLMGNDVPPRRDFIVASANRVDRDHLDV